MVPPIVAIRIPKGVKSRIRRLLSSTYGLDQESLFPDLSGFAAAHGVDGRALA